MTIPLGRRRLVISIALLPSQPRYRARPVADGATDVELARLNRREAGVKARTAWEVWTKLFGPPRP